MSGAAEGWGKSQSDRIKSIGANRVIFYAATGTMVDMDDRIWGKGQLTDGSTLKYNEDYEYYGYKPPLPRKPTGKGKTGKPIKGGYYSTYLAMKTSQDRGGSPFELTGDMRKAWYNGPTPTPTEISPLECVIQMDRDQYKKAEGLSKSKGPFLVLNAAELAGYYKRVNTLLAR